MKFGIKLNNIEIAGVKIGGVEVTTDFSINEMIAMRKETEAILKNMPEYLSDLESAVNKFEEIDNRMESKAEEEMQEALIKSAIQNKFARILRDMNSVG